ncbi:MAG TPA: S9 family peptidase [Methanotrichaceae archaeon]|nr:S9 family peptidase [Methanotrichaceae archaeon]
MKIFIILIALTVLLMSGCVGDKEIQDRQNEENESLISRDLLFGNPDRITTRISPDGLKMSFLAPVNGVLNVWVGPADELEKARPVTNDTHRGIRSYLWAHTNEHILYLQDRDGDENWRIYSVNLSSEEIKDLTPFEDVQAEFKSVSYKIPKDVIIGLNKRDPKFHDIYKLNIETGNLTLVMENTEFSGFDIDDNYKIQLALKVTPDGGAEISKLTENGWESFQKIGMEDVISTGTLSFNKTSDVVYMTDSRGRDTAAIYAVNLSTGDKTLIAEDPRADFSGYLIHPTEKVVQAVAFNYERIQWNITDSSIADDLEYLRELEDGDWLVVSRSLDDRIWIVVYTVDDGPARYYYYDRDAGEARFLFTDREKLEGLSLARMTPVIITSRDNLSLVSYYTLPPGSDSNGDDLPDSPLPMVLYVHGGPWSRDVWGFNSVHQWLANRGYAVLSVNFRGSTGFGKNFTNAANLEWGRKMHDDLIDAVNWSVEQGIADPERIAIMGGSYGGYATLAGLTFTPKVFACGVDIVGPSNLITLLETVPPYWQPEIELYTTRVGDHRTEEGKKLLQERSPLNYTDKIERPLLIGQGANDPRVKQNESDQIVNAMQAKNLSVIYVLYPDEGHGFARPDNRLSFYAIAEAFLARHLGGRYEPIGDDFTGANITVPVSAEEIPGLKEALLNRS